MRDRAKKGDLQGLSLKQLRRRRWLQSRGRWIAGGVVVVVVVLVAVWLVYFSPVFAVKHLKVEGASGAQRAQVEKTAQAPFDSALIDVDTNAIRRRVQHLAWVKEVSVARSWPQTITVTVVARTPVAAVQSGSTLRNIDATGVLFGSLAKQPNGVPLITLSGNVDSSGLLAAATVAGSLPRGILKRVSAIAVRTMDDIRLNLADGSTVLWGSADDSATKSQVATALLKLHSSVIDVSVPSHPTTS